MARLAWLGLEEMGRAARRWPLIAAALTAAAVIVAARTGNLRAETWRTRGRAIEIRLRPLVDQFVVALEEHAESRGELFVVEASSRPTTIQIAARHLARRGEAITASELRDELSVRGHRIPATRLRAEMRTHRAFVRLPGDRYTIGQTVRRPQIEAAASD